MEMWELYIQATRGQVPEVAKKIVFDRFRVMSHIRKAVGAVLKQEHCDQTAAGDETVEGSKYLWLYSRENVPELRRK